jgi:hypothetical protein
LLHGAKSKNNPAKKLSDLNPIQKLNGDESFASAKRIVNSQWKVALTQIKSQFRELGKLI